jgi:signal transduction histidine kinase
MPLKTQSPTSSATTAIVQERRRISRDLHDSTIQPYLGLKLGLEALRRRLAGSGPIEREVDELIHMADEGITELRRYVGNLTHAGRQGPSLSLAQGIRDQARKTGELYGLRVDVIAECDVVVSARLFEELMYMLREALANVRRHSDARRAAVTLRVRRGGLELEIANDRRKGAEVALEFNPRSIDERARELGGRVRVWAPAGADSLVTIEVPL